MAPNRARASSSCHQDAGLEGALARLRTENAVLKADNKLLAKLLAEENMNTEQRRALERTLTEALNDLERLQSRPHSQIQSPGGLVKDTVGLVESVHELQEAVTNLVMDRANLRRRKLELQKQIERLKAENRSLTIECASLKKRLSTADEPVNVSNNKKLPILPLPKATHASLSPSASSLDGRAGWVRNYIDRILRSKMFSTNLDVDLTLSPSTTGGAEDAEDNEVD